MKNNERDFFIELQVDRKANDDHAFCNIILKIDRHSIGNADEWTVAGLAAASIGDMVSRLKCQTLLRGESLAYLANIGPEELFRSFYEWQWGDGSFCYEPECTLSSVNPEIFFALPIGTEIFDGECVYAIRLSPNMTRFVWRDFESGNIHEHYLDFDTYLERWSVTQKDLELAMAK